MKSKITLSEMRLQWSKKESEMMEEREWIASRIEGKS